MVASIPLAVSPFIPSWLCVCYNRFCKCFTRKVFSKNILTASKIWPADFLPNRDDINVIQTHACVLNDGDSSGFAHFYT
jgi:hypothetical protein